MSNSLNFKKATELLHCCEASGKTIAEITIARESDLSGKTEEDLLRQMGDHFRKMKESIGNGLALHNRSSSGLSGGDAAKIKAYAESDDPLLGTAFARTIAYGFAVLESNAQFGRIIATPTAGSSGILPSCLLILAEVHGVAEERLVKSLFTAAGIGVIIGENASFSGARGGCQAEVGSASCMAAAGIVEAMGGTPQQALSAASFALMNTLGLVCDPIGGFVEIPCVSRNGMFAVHSFQAAVIALSGANCFVPLDDVIIAMRDIGRRMPRALKETSQGGLAVTPTGKKFPPLGF